MKGAEDFQLETKSRGEELNALAQAKKILQEALPAAFNQVSFLQLSRSELYTGARLLPKPGCKGIGFQQISLNVYILYHK